MSSALLENLPGLPLDGAGPVFREPWEARAFALACQLLDEGVFTRSEWAEELGHQIEQARAAGDPDRGDTYYHHWLNCLESLVVRKGLADEQVLKAHKQAAHEAHQAMHASLGHIHSH